jgi:hypothetical protein
MADEERTPQAETLMPRPLPAAEGVRPGATTQLAFGIDTGQSGQGGSLHGGLLEHREGLSPGLQTTRHRLSTPLR